MSPDPLITKEQIQTALQQIDQSPLNDWERGFVESCRRFWSQTGKLSEKQSKRLIEIYRRQRNASAKRA